MAQIEGNNLSLGYDGKTVVENINFQVNKGDYLCILGENGAGKSTLMKAILGLKKAMAGEIILENDLKRNEFGYLTQQSDVQKDFPASVFEIVLSGFQGKMGFRPFYTKKEKHIALNNMEKVNILDLKKACFSELSGGQQQRVLLARALCATQKILFLDEPVGGLDANVSRELYEIIEKLNKEDNISVIMISHDLETAIKYATHILHIGSKNFYGLKEEYIKDESVKTWNGGQI